MIGGTGIVTPAMDGPIMTSLLNDPRGIKKVLRSFTLSSHATGTSPSWWEKDAAHWLKVCRNCATPVGRIKMAELGGGQDTPFEQAFSNLAHAYIKDKAPKLLDYEVGFQLLEKNQDNNKAVGVFGFKVGSQWLYAPVFFLNGDLKGHELLYIKNQDQFVPLKENWLNYILGRKPTALGESMNRNLSLVGVQPPNLYQLSRSPHKFAAELPSATRTGRAVGSSAPAQPVAPLSAAQTAAPGLMSTAPPMSNASRGMMYADANNLGAPAPLAPSQMTGSQPPVPQMAGSQTPMPRMSMPRPPMAPQSGPGPGIVPPPNPMMKMGANAPRMAGWASDFMPTLANWATVSTNQHPKYQGMKELPDFLKEAGEDTLRFVIEGIGKSYPAVFNCFDNLYGEGMLDDAVKSVQEAKRAAASRSFLKQSTSPSCGMGMMRKKKRKKKASFLDQEKQALGVRHEVIDETTFKAHPDIIHSMSKDEKEKLLKERVVIRDSRGDNEVTHAYDVQTPMKLQSPDATGLYEVLTSPDTFERCLVVMAPYSHKQRHNFCTVVRLDGDKNWVNTHPANVWVRAEMDMEGWKKWLEKQPEADTLKVNDSDNPWAGPRYILMSPKGEATCPFYCREKYEGGKDDSIAYEADFDWHTTGRRPAYLPSHTDRDVYDPYRDGHSCYDHEAIVLTKLPGVKIRVDHNSGLQVPANFKLIEVRAARKKKELTPDQKKSPMSYERYESDPPPVRLASLTDVQLAIMANTRPMKIFSDGKDVTVDENRMDKTSALIHLCRHYGFREKTAHQLLNLAAERKVYEFRYAMPEDFEKYADPSGDMIRGAPNAPPFPEPYMGYDPMTGGNIPTMQESEFNMKIPDMSASKTDRSIYQPTAPDPKTMAIAQQAGQKGQREVFDTAMLGGLLKSVRQDTMVDRYLPDMMKGMDRLGRVYFQLLWHGEEFEERYGKEDLPELEDSVRNAFEAIGDVTLELKKQTVEAFPDEGTDVDLGPVANQ